MHKQDEGDVRSLLFGNIGSSSKVQEISENQLLDRRGERFEQHSMQAGRAVISGRLGLAYRRGGKSGGKTLSCGRVWRVTVENNSAHAMVSLLKGRNHACRRHSNGRVGQTGQALFAQKKTRHWSVGDQ